MNKIIDYISEHPFESGLISISLAFLLIGFTLHRKESHKMKDHNLASWKGYVNQIGVIILLLIYGIILLLRYING